MTPSNRATALYRLFDHAGRLLYVCIAYDPSTRWYRHRLSHERWEQVDESRTTIVWFETRDEARASEIAAIRSEQPAWNVRDISPDNGALERDRHVGGRHIISLPNDMWDALGNKVGPRNRSHIIRTLVGAYLAGSVQYPDEQLDLFAA